MNLDQCQEARRIIGLEQAQLLKSLSGGLSPTPGFDSERLEATRRSLSRKRARSAAKSWPGLEQELLGRYAELFAAYAASSPLPREGGPLADSMRFVGWLKSRQPIPASIQRRRGAIELDYRDSPHGLVRRKGWRLAGAWISDARVLVLSVRLPWLGVRSWNFHLPRALDAWFRTRPHPA